MWFALLTSLFVALHAHAVEPAVFNETGEHMVLTPHMGWYFDHAETLTPEEAQALFEAGKFNPIEGEWLELGLHDAVMWMAVTVRNDSPAENLMLEVRNPRMSYLDLYVPNENGEYEVILNGAARPFESRPLEYPMPVFPVTIKPGDTQTLLLRVDNLGDFRWRVWLWDVNAFANRMTTAYYPEFITIGILSVLALFHLLVFLSLRESAYLHLSLFVLNWMLFFMASNGTGHMLLWKDFPWLALRANSIFMTLMCASFITFGMSFLESRKHSPVLYKVALGFLVLCGIHLLFISFTDSLLRIAINRYVYIGTLIVLTLLVVSAIRAGSRMAYFFLATWIFVVAGGGLMLLLSWYVVSVRWIIGSPLINILYTGSIIFWSFELTGRVKERLQEQQRILEVKVRERTRELEQALSEVKTLSGLLPICASCKKIRDDKGYWNSVEHYLQRHTEAEFSHGICPDCYTELYPELANAKSGPTPGS